jgi:glycosyltransferase involved in cell wall biosynthesis
MDTLITIIIPIYNEESVILRSVSSLKSQTFGFEKMEIIIVNDGSEDDSDLKCKALEKKYKNIHYFCNEHRGVSAARNTGIKAATGKYIFFLDADDKISRNTVKDCVQLFDSMYDQVDLLTYPIDTYYKGRKLEPHFRYKYLTRSGIVDLKTEAFVGQTTMNIVVKNKFDFNILFDEKMSFSEDQKYCCDVLHDKLKMGFCASAKYYYYRSEESTSGKLSGACYIFETSMKMFEDIFSRYEIVPLAFQGLFVNDIYWKMLENILFPYHYDSFRYQEAIGRIKALLRRCNNYVILSHPNFDYYEKFYLMHLKGEEFVQVKTTKNEISIFSEGNEVFRSKYMEMVLTKVQVRRHHVRILGFLKSVFFIFYKEPIKLYAIENEIEYKLIELRPSAHNYYRSHEPTQRFYAIDYDCNVQNISSLRFELHLDETILPVGYYIMPLVPFSDNHIYHKKDVQISLQNGKWDFLITDYKSTKQIWLYYDCQGVEIDNGLRQFNHDNNINDGVDRYYVYTDKKQLKHLSKNAQKVKFGSLEHKKLFLQADKVITAYIENDNIIPYSENDYSRYSNKMHFETIYLQHGVLHIDMPWKYSQEKIMADKIVVSTNVDYNLFLRNGYRDEDLWKTGMPRFGKISSVMRSQKKILFAPSWRSYLVTSKNGHGFSVLENKFYFSKYYLGIRDFLESDSLHEILKKNSYILDVKLHPIFMGISLNINIDEKYIHFVDEVDEDVYGLFITDFSSYMFDFLYRNIPVLSFIPDYEEFMCGMNGYRKVDFIDNVRDEEVCTYETEIISSINEFIENGKGMDYHVEFFVNDGNSTEEIYKHIVNELD